jgi:RND family efflux transporter MFP subunit
MELPMKRIWIVLGILAGIMIIAGAGYLGFRSSKPQAATLPPAPQTVAATRCDVEQSVTAPGSVVNFNERPINMPVDGSLNQVLVQPGDAVKAGDVLAILMEDPVRMAKARLDVAQAQSDLLAAQDAQQKAERGLAALHLPRASKLELEQASLALDAAAAQRDAAHQDFNVVAGLPTNDPQRMAALAALDAATQVYNQAASNYNWLSGHASDADTAAAKNKVDLADANVALAQAALTKAQASLDFLTKGVITAPFAGVILKSIAQTGMPFTAGASLFTIHDPKDVEIQSNVTEEDFPFISVGQKVKLFFDALPDVEASGVISRIVPTRISGDRPLYYLYIRMDSVPDHLVEGMTVDGAIVLAQRSQVVCLPRAVVHASSADTATLEIWNGITTLQRQVKLGLRGDVYIEIVSGLQVGDQVVTK